MELRPTNSACNCVLLCGLTLCVIFGTKPTSGIDMYAPSEVIAENATTVILKCSFKSAQMVSSKATVTWSFRRAGSDASSSGISIFYFSAGTPYSGNLPQFEERVQWVGDLNKKDASIKLLNTQFNDNGTYSCDVKNPPDISGTPSHTELKVVVKEALPQNNTAIIVGAVCGAVIGLILIAVVTYLIIKRPRNTYITSTECESTLVTRPGKKPESSTEGSRCSSPSAPIQGPVIYAQLDHSGKKNPNSFHKMEPVVYADIRKN